MTPAQEFREAQDWLAKHKRDPFLWIIIVMPLTFTALALVGNIVLPSAFPFHDAERALTQVIPAATGPYGCTLPGIELVRSRATCRLPTGTYIFGYDFGAASGDGGKDHSLGRICRDVVNGGWIVAFDNPKFRYLDPQILPNKPVVKVVRPRE